jgi:gliding motility-associated lipoprotein GldD
MTRIKHFIVKFQYVFCIGFFAFLIGCHGEFSPKNKAYPRVIYPTKSYEIYQNPNCPFMFEKPVYARVGMDTTFMGVKTKEPCWFNVEFPDFNGSINVTYKELNSSNTLEKLLEDAHKMSFKHSKKANYIEEIAIENKYGVRGLVYDVGGDAASNLQFYLTDDKRHYIRGALYFNNEPNTDSMAPIINFVKADLDHFFETFQWK